MRLAVAALVALLVVPAALAATAKPHVRLARQAPVVVSGAGFRPGEHVRVRVSNGTIVLSKRVRATARGGFTARFVRTVSTPACGQVAVTAIGALGDHAVWKTPPQLCGAQPPVDQ